MLDHILGKPSYNIKRLRVAGLLYICSLVFFGNKKLIHGKLYDKINDQLRKYSPTQLIFLTLSVTYCLKNALMFVGLHPPNAMAHMYNRNFFRATYIFTAACAGSLTAAPIKPKFLRDAVTLIFIVYYLIFPDHVEERMKAEYRVVTQDTMRNAWEVETNMYVKAVSYLIFPQVAINKKIFIPRASDSPHGTEPVEATLFFDGTQEELSQAKKLIFHIPGGGFVCLNPECYGSYLKPLAKHTKIPIISFNYHKAPEYPYPYALNELFDAYRTICATSGRCIGIDSLPIRPKIQNGVQYNEINIAVTGDSAGGNLTASLMLMVLESSQNLGDHFILPRPKGLVMVYPALDFDMGVWMNKDHLKLFRQQSVKSLTSLWETKNHYNHQSPLATYDDTKKWGGLYQNPSIRDQVEENIPKKPDVYKVPSQPGIHHIDSSRYPWVRNKNNPMAMGSKITYFDDRVLCAELFRVSAIWYVGPNNSSDFQTDYYIAPLLAPDHLLAQFPKTYFLCGERDPLVDDTIIMSGKIRNAKRRSAKLIPKRRKNEDRLDIQKMTPFSNSQVTLDKSIDGFIVGNDTSVENSNHSSDDEDLSNSSDDESIFSTATIVPKAKSNIYNRLVNRVRSYVSLLQQPPAVPNGNIEPSSTASNEDVHVKIITGVSHGFLSFQEFLPEGKAAVKLTGNWLIDILDDEKDYE